MLFAGRRIGARAKLGGQNLLDNVERQVHVDTHGSDVFAEVDCISKRRPSSRVSGTGFRGEKAWACFSWPPPPPRGVNNPTGIEGT